MKKKNFFKPREISCARCGFRGLARRNRVHAGLLVVLALFLFSQMFSDLRFLGSVGMLVNLLFVVPVLAGVARLVIHDERALVCPGCGNVNYDLVRE